MTDDWKSTANELSTLSFHLLMFKAIDYYWLRGSPLLAKPVFLHKSLFNLLFDQFTHLTAVTSVISISNSNFIRYFMRQLYYSDYANPDNFANINNWWLHPSGVFQVDKLCPRFQHTIDLNRNNQSTFESIPLHFNRLCVTMINKKFDKWGK